MYKRQVVWSEKKELCNFPTKEHKYHEEAGVEALRLAQKHRGIKFHVMSRMNTIQIVPDPLTKNGIIKKIKKFKAEIAGERGGFFSQDYILDRLDNILDRSGEE